MTAPDRRAVAIAGHNGDLATIDAGWTSENPAVRATALGAWERIGRLDAGRLAEALADADPGVRRRAALLAATHRDVDLLPALADGDAMVVEAAAWAAGEHERATDAIVERLCLLGREAADPLVREAAVAALGAIGDPRGVPTILIALEDKPAIRRRAVLALAPFDGPEVEAALERATTDRDWQVRQAVEDLRRAARHHP